MARPEAGTPAKLYPYWPDGHGCTLTGRDRAVAETLRIAVVRIEAAMVEHEWSLRQMAQATGVNHVSLHHMLRGDIWPNAEHLAQIEQALQLQLWPRLGEVSS